MLVWIFFQAPCKIDVERVEWWKQQVVVANEQVPLDEFVVVGQQLLLESFSQATHVVVRVLNSERQYLARGRSGSTILGAGTILGAIKLGAMNVDSSSRSGGASIILLPILG